MPRKVINKRKLRDSDKAIMIGDYIKKKDAFHYAAGRITPEGEMLVYWEGKWMPNKTFLELKVSPTNINFRANKNNVDGTKKYLL